MTSEWRSALARYAGGDWTAGIRQLSVTIGLYIIIWYAAYRSLEVSYWLTLAIALPLAGILVRLFTIQHDCGHGSFLPSAGGNDWIGRGLGLLTLTPFRYWRRFHALHHATSGKLERRGVYDIITLTVREYRALPWWKRGAYRVYRHPLFLFAIAPTVLFVVLHRLPWLAPKSWRAERRSILGTDLGLALLLAILAATVGVRALLLIQGPVSVIASGAGMWLFYVQHQFEDAYWEPSERWDFAQASLAGSSYYALPAWLHWFTGHIGLHHIHHLNTRIPNYRLQACLDENPELPQAARLTLRDSFRCVQFKLWDEERSKLVPIPNARS